VIRELDEPYNVADSKFNKSNWPMPLEEAGEADKKGLLITRSVAGLATVLSMFPLSGAIWRIVVVGLMSWVCVGSRKPAYIVLSFAFPVSMVESPMPGGSSSCKRFLFATAVSIWNYT
jgi:hypothetical protein